MGNRDSSLGDLVYFLAVSLESSSAVVFSGLDYNTKTSKNNNNISSHDKIVEKTMGVYLG